MKAPCTRNTNGGESRACAKPLDGNASAERVKQEVAEGVRALVSLFGEAARPRLALVLCGDDPVSARLVGMKKRDCESVGVAAEVFRLPEETASAELVSFVRSLAEDPAVTGILVQLPLPAHISTERVLAAIPQEKDADGFAAKISMRPGDIAPCTPAGILRLLDDNGVDPAGKNAVIIGRSNIVGKPMAICLLLRDATVTVCHTKTKNLREHLKNADIVIAAAGCPGLVTGDMLKPGAVVVDVGMTYTKDGIRGDADHDSVAETASFLTPVPGGVGPMTRAMLLHNTLRLAQMQHDGV